MGIVVEKETRNNPLSAKLRVVGFDSITVNNCIGMSMYTNQVFTGGRYSLRIGELSPWVIPLLKSHLREHINIISMPITVFAHATKHYQDHIFNCHSSDYGNGIREALIRCHERQVSQFVIGTFAAVPRLRFAAGRRASDSEWSSLEFITALWADL